MNIFVVWIQTAFRSFDCLLATVFLVIILSNITVIDISCLTCISSKFVDDNKNGRSKQRYSVDQIMHRTQSGYRWADKDIPSRWKWDDNDGGLRRKQVQRVTTETCFVPAASCISTPYWILDSSQHNSLARNTTCSAVLILQLVRCGK